MGCGRFRRSDRLLRSADFRRVAEQGERWASRHFILLFAPMSFSEAAKSESNHRAQKQSGSSMFGAGGIAAPIPLRRLGITVSRKVGNAVVRNRVKRVVRAWFGRERENLPKNVDIVVIARRGVGELASSEMVTSLVRLTASFDHDEAARS